VTPSGELMLAGTENSVSLPLLSVPVDGQMANWAIFHLQGRKITPSFLYRHFGHETLWTQDTSAPSRRVRNVRTVRHWCRSIHTTLRHQCRTVCS